MKRAILGLLAAASLAILLSILAGVFDLTGATRLLTLAGAGLLLVTAVDGIRSDLGATPLTTAPLVTPAMPTGPTATPTANASPMPAPPVRPAPASAGTAAPPTTAATRKTEVSTDRSDEFVIDLRDHADSNEGARVVEQLIADGQLSQTNGPISDDDVPRILMAALVD